MATRHRVVIPTKWSWGMTIGMTTLWRVAPPKTAPRNPTLFGTRPYVLTWERHTKPAILTGYSRPFGHLPSHLNMIGVSFWLWNLLRRPVGSCDIHMHGHIHKDTDTDTQTQTRRQRRAQTQTRTRIGPVGRGGLLAARSGVPPRAG